MLYPWAASIFRGGNSSGFQNCSGALLALSLPASSRILCFFLTRLGDGSDKSVIWIAIRHEGADRQQQCGNGQDRRPVALQNIQADSTITVNVAVINLRPESHLINIYNPFQIFFKWIEEWDNYFHLWGFVWVLWWEVNIQDENTIFVDWVGRTNNDCNPLV